jgi:hypothetical protein
MFEEQYRSRFRFGEELAQVVDMFEEGEIGMHLSSV